MQHSPTSIRAALLLTNRLVTLQARPLVASEFWRLADRVDPGDLLELDVSSIAARAEVEHDEAVRYRSLLDAATALSFEEERLGDGGITLVSALDERFPNVLRERLGAGCPPFLLVAGPMASLERLGLAVIGGPDAGDDALAAARRAGSLAAARAQPVVVGLTGAVDDAAMNGARDVGGSAVAVPGEGIMRASRIGDVRRRVHAGELCLVSPYAPDAPARVSFASGRTKVIYALSELAFVVSTDNGSGTAWAGAKEALDQRYSPVAAWVGAEASEGNHALVRHGAKAVTDVAQLATIDTTLTPPPTQNHLF